ncbi:hypothetical protein DYBT9275_01327 [Dyadobacter sp. CECT 9275]|uniref:Uncharacterized protein n=1 Tax=Dyadobacter helix TaxID=2822344 RepID=A0A916JAB8_9BACT|nr:hypothetical protein DYBT9275_01327 [Dyadobacter sp. CECT 9275]
MLSNLVLVRNGLKERMERNLNSPKNSPNPSAERIIR